MNYADIARICHSVSDFSKRENYTYKALPVIVWEFETIADFAHAKAELTRAIHEWQPHTSGFARLKAPDRCELDCYGVTFRLICKQVLMTPHGPFGAAELGIKRVTIGEGGDAQT